MARGFPSPMDTVSLRNNTADAWPQGRRSYYWRTQRACDGTLIERKGGLVILCATNSEIAEDVRRGITHQLRRINRFLHLSMPYNRESEMAEQPTMCKRLQKGVLYC